MRLFGYYAWHSFANQIKKLFKTWVLIFLLVCVVIGALIGVGVATLEVAAEADEEVIVETVPEEEEDPITLEESLGITPLELTELIVGGIILAVFVFNALNADKNGSKIFLPADVNLLFASPMKPQSVLLFRLTTQLGAILLSSIYLLFQLPNLVLNLGLTVWAGLASIATWCLTILVGKLLQVLLYTVFSTHAKLKSYLRRGIYALLLILGAGFVAYWRACGENRLMVAANQFFNSPASCYVPFWGWLKGFCMFAMEGKLGPMLLCLAALAAGCTALAYVIWHVKADFYEDAMAKSEETAELLARAQSEKGTIALVKRKKDRSDRLRRDGMRHGKGANVFFFKAMYNRFRFAHFGVFTKTSETYLVAGLGVAALCRFLLDTEGLIPVVFTLAAFCFFRALGNPMSQDTEMDHFLLIPESTWSKLFWSLMGGTANCLLDLLPAIIAASLLLGENLLTALAWLPFIVSVDFFATTVNTFINLSVPASTGKTIKQLIQIMFIYFGLLPDVAIMAVGIVFDFMIPAAFICSGVNICLGLVFFFLCPLFLEPGNGKKYVPDTGFAGDLGAAKKQFSRLGMGAFVILAVGAVAQILAANLAVEFLPGLAQHPWGIWVLTFAPMYLIAVPLGLLILKKAPATTLEKRSIKPGQMAVCAIICIFLMYTGNLLATLISTLLQLIPGVSAGNPLLTYANDESVLAKVLVMVILAPVIEEFIFRKLLIDRMHIYGEKLAVFTSALMFGLFHGNLTQLIYAFALGLVFGYVYLKSGKLRYSIGLHMLINFLGSVAGPGLVAKVSTLAEPEALDTAAMVWMVVFVVYLLAIIGLSIAGLLLLCVNQRKVTYNRAELELPKGSRFRTVYLNAGMLLLVLSCLALVLLNILYMKPKTRRRNLLVFCVQRSMLRYRSTTSFKKISAAAAMHATASTIQIAFRFSRPAAKCSLSAFSKKIRLSSSCFSLICCLAFSVRRSFSAFSRQIRICSSASFQPGMVWNCSMASS